MNKRSFASLNISCETLKIGIENQWGRSRDTVLHANLNNNIRYLKKIKIQCTNTTVYLQGKNVFYLNFYIFTSFFFLLCFKRLGFIQGHLQVMGKQ